MRKALLIYNPAAGRFPAQLLVDRAKRILEDADWDVSLATTTSGESLYPLAAGAARNGLDAVFVAGGDGSVGAAGSALIGSKTALGVLPAGTSNVWAQDMGMETLAWSRLQALDHAASRLAHGQIRQVDVGFCNGRPFLLWTGIGLDGQMTGSIEPMGRVGKTFAVPQYFTRGVWNARDWEGMPLQVEALGRSWEDHFLVIIASNISSYAGGILHLTPDAKVDDGLIDFWLVGGSSLRDAVVRVYQVLRGKHLDEPRIVHFQAAQATIKGDGLLPMQCDGEPGRIKPPLNFSVQSRALHVLVPHDDIPRLFTEA